jgi:hypothetical protein
MGLRGIVREKRERNGKKKRGKRERKGKRETGSLHTSTPLQAMFVLEHLG